MKTHKVRPVLMPVDKSFLYLHGGKLYNNRTTMHIPDGKQQPQQLILISLEDEKIEVGDRVIYDFFDGHKVDVIVDNTIDTYPERWLGFKRVIACQSQLSLEYIQQFIEEYNKGEVKDISIEMEECTDGNGMYRNSKMFQPKLNNGHVTIVEKLQMPKISADDLPLANGDYTEEEVKELIIQALLEVDTLVTTCGQRDGWVELNNKEIDNWFNQNKKK